MRILLLPVYASKRVLDLGSIYRDPLPSVSQSASLLSPSLINFTVCPSWFSTLLGIVTRPSHPGRRRRTVLSRTTLSFTSLCPPAAFRRFGARLAHGVSYAATPPHPIAYITSVPQHRQPLRQTGFPSRRGRLRLAVKMTWRKIRRGAYRCHKSSR